MAVKSGVGSRIVVTGMGCISAAGLGVDALWDSASAGRVNVKTYRHTQLDGPLSVYSIPELPSVSPADRRLTRKADRSALLALEAARQAWQASKLDEHPVAPHRTGLVVGSSRGPAEINAMSERNAKKNPTDSVYTAFSSITGVISAALGIQGCSFMTSATCISGAMALKAAMQLIQSEELDVVLTGAVDAPLIDSLLAQFAATNVLSKESGSGVLRPFDQNRSGTVLGEGAAFVVLENEASARRRRIVSSGVLHHVAVRCDSILRAGGDRDATGLRTTAEQVLQRMDLQPGKIDLVHLHGTGTQLNDAMESQFVRETFGPEKDQPHAWASKGITGHTLGGSALFQAILTLKALEHSFIPKTSNCEVQDPACTIRLTGKTGVEKRIENAICVTSGFWGNTACVGLGRYDDRG